MRALLTLALLLPGSAFACAMPAELRDPDQPKLVVDIGPGAQLEALFQSIEGAVVAPVLGVPAPLPVAVPVVPAVNAPPPSVIPEAQAPVVPRT